MIASTAAFLDNPGLVAWGIFWLYLVLILVGTYTLIQTFKSKRILFGHFDDFFQFLTRIRIWSIRYRKTYTLIITSLLAVTFLMLVYWSELLHEFLYGAEPAFSGFFDYALWITVFVVSGLTEGPTPNSLIGMVLSGVFPLFVIGSVLTIVRYTSEHAHDRLVNRMAQGDIAPYRAIILNYHESHDEFIRALLDRSNAFVVIFAKSSNLHDARSFVEGFEGTDRQDYRIAIEELSYSEDLLFEQYDVLAADDLFVLPDKEDQTDYENLRAITTLNQEAARREENPVQSVDVPNTVWITDSSKLAGAANTLEHTQFTQRLISVSFQEDITDLIRLNTSNSLDELNHYFKFEHEQNPPETVSGHQLANYTFYGQSLTDEELEAFTEIKQYRTKIEQDQADTTQRSRLAAMKRNTLKQIQSRLRNEFSDKDPAPVSAFYGLLMNVADATVPIKLLSAYGNQQVETSTHTLQVRDDESVTIPEEAIGSTDGDIFVVNYNVHLKQFIQTFGTHGSEQDRHLTIYTSTNQVTPDSPGNVNYVEYDSMMSLLQMLFSETEESPRCVKPGDTVMVFTDHTIENPVVNVLRVLDAIDDKLQHGSAPLSHNDIFLAVETDIRSGNEEYRYLSVDKIIDTQRPQELFLHNLVQLLTNDLVQSMVIEGKLSRQEAFQWATETAHYFQEFQIDDCNNLERVDTAAESIHGAKIADLVEERREYGEQRPLPFTTFSLFGTDDGDLEVQLNEANPDRKITKGDFLISLPQV